MQKKVTLNNMLLKVGWFFALFSVLAAGLSVAYATQQQIKENDLREMKTTATIAFADQNWAESKECNIELIEHDHDDEKAWFNLGLSQHYLGEYDEARISFNKAIELGFEPGINHYNIACTYAREQEFDTAITHIRRSIEYGFPVEKFAEQDPDMEVLRTTGAFQEVLELTEKSKN